jgi:hypothetical protein
VPERIVSEKSLQHQAAAYARHSMCGSAESTAAARARGPASIAFFERRVDADGVFDPVERRRRAEFAKRSYFLRLAHLSVKSRRAKSGAAS